MSALDTTSLEVFFPEYEFPNLNRVPYFRHEKDLAEIKKLESNKNWEKLYPALKRYVQRFGIQNFYKDTYLLWKLAKLAEILEKENEAIFLYKLVIKHHRADIDIRKVEATYDSLAANKEAHYVPLDYYYELVEYRKQIDTLVAPRSVLTLMDTLINSKQSDYGPSLSYDNQTFIFTSKRNKIPKGAQMVENEDLFFSRRVNEVWTKAQIMKGLNSAYNEGSAKISKDGKTLYLTRCNANTSYGNCDLYTSTLQDDSTWSEPKNMGININSVAWDSHPSLSPNEDTLYFASDRMGGFGMSDIYYTYKTGNGEWSPARNLGPVVNTRNNEVSPFYHPSYHVLYFSSNGHKPNFGEFDIYKSLKKANFFMEPKNIGPLVNGKGSEFYFTIDSQSKDLYYSKSNANTNYNMDLFSFPLPMEAQPNATTRVSGSLTDSLTGKPFQGIVSIIDLDNGVEVAPQFLRPDGSFEFELINNNNYLLVIQGSEFFRIEEIFYLDGETEINRKVLPLAAKMKFASIEFENGMAELLPEMYGDLNNIINFLFDNPDFYLRIAGHTDSSGDPDFNMLLSSQRARSIYEYIVDLYGVPADRVEYTGFGSTRPIIAEELNDEHRKINRRVEFEIYRIAD
ncbi:OmpA family protein [Cytophagales bacterium LB-30]|uniref:OmpA family protein n=1 Tax=Shiella aurantiaca TaxID=3058365 RepID=A0ABT8F768_9BACT|nr:OmpA family protein [Shiella aurantiaca]MDN4166277.1 OmpA family protein [Shiella aurantiaca]